MIAQHGQRILLCGPFVSMLGSETRRPSNRRLLPSAAPKHAHSKSSVPSSDTTHGATTTGGFRTRATIEDRPMDQRTTEAIRTADHPRTLTSPDLITAGITTTRVNQGGVTTIGTSQTSTEGTTAVTATRNVPYSIINFYCHGLKSSYGMILDAMKHTDCMFLSARDNQ